MPTRTQPRPRLSIELLECRQLLNGMPLSPSFIAPMEHGTHGIYASFSMTDESGSWFRRLGSYPIMIVEKGSTVPRYTEADLTVTGHASRFIYGVRDAA